MTIISTNSKSIWNEPLFVEPAIIWHSVLSPVLATFWITSVAAVSHFIPEAACGHKGHNLVVIYTHSSVRISLVKGLKLSVDTRHDVGIVKGVFQGLKVACPNCGVGKVGQH